MCEEIVLYYVCMYGMQYRQLTRIYFSVNYFWKFANKKWNENRKRNDDNNGGCAHSFDGKWSTLVSIRADGDQGKEEEEKEEEYEQHTKLISEH